MRDLYDVIISPVVTEKATAEQEARNVYTFIVHRDASKPQIADAVETAAPELQEGDGPVGGR
jgi:ribosomal protein L23